MAIFLSFVCLGQGLDVIVVYSLFIVKFILCNMEVKCLHYKSVCLIEVEIV